MSNNVNPQRLSDSSIQSYEKLRASVYLKKDTFIKIDSLIKLADCQSRNDVIEKAVAFYFGFITSQLSQEFLCATVGSKVEGLVGNLGTRISRGNFRTAVEMDMLTKMLASVIHVSGAEYSKLRVKSIHDVKTTNGSIDLLKAVNESESGDFFE